MSKKIITWFIIAMVLIIVGGTIFVGVMSNLKWDFKALDTTKYESNIHTINDQFNSISIDTDTLDVLFLKSDDGVCKIECLEYQGENHSVEVKDETLNVKTNETKEWYKRITFFSFDEPQIKVYLPQYQYDSLIVNISTGDVKISGDFTFNNIDVKGSTSDIDIKNITAGDIKLVVTTGDVDVSNVTCSSFVSSGNTGDISLKNVDAGKNLSITRSTGDVNFEQCDADKIFVNTDTGDVEGSLLTSKIFDCKTNTGEITLPNTIEGGKCEIITDTGDITIVVKKNMTSGYCIR